MKKYLLALLTVVLTACAAQQPVATDADSRIEEILKTQLVFGAAPGIAVGTLNQGERRFYRAGVRDLSTAAPFDEFTFGEIGSVTKTFTALLWADLAARDSADLLQPVNTFLPEGMQLPEKNGKAVRIIELLNHTSGLPREPDDLPKVTVSRQPFADYDEADMAAYLQRLQLENEPGAHFSYSNTGMGLAGLALRQLTGRNIYELYEERIFQPFGLEGATCRSEKPSGGNVAQGYLGTEPHDPFAFTEVFAGAGCIRSNTAEMLNYLELLMGEQAGSLDGAIALMRQPTFAVEDAGLPPGYHSLQFGLGLGMLTNDQNETVYFHDGSTYGCSAFLLFNPDRRLGVFLLANSGLMPTIRLAALEIMAVLSEE